MEDYEIRDIHRRASTPDLWVEFRFDTGAKEKIIFQHEASQSNPISLHGILGNRSREPAMYSVIKIYLDARFTLVSSAGFSPAGTVKIEGRSLNVISKAWAIPVNLPIFSEQPFALSEQPIRFSLAEEALGWLEFLIGYDIRAPGFADQKLFRVVNQPSGTLCIAREVNASD
jgi:hypothetical protein